MALSWSLSSIITFRICPRKHFFSHVLAKNYEKSTLLQKQAYWLKKSITLDMWAGELIDQVVTTKIIPIYEEKGEPDFNEIENYAIDLLRRQWKFSKTSEYKAISNKQVPEEYCILDIHENNTSFQKEELEAVVHKVKTSIQNFPTIKLPDGKLLIDLLRDADWLSPNRNDRHVNVGDANVGPQIDLLFWKTATQYVIDWKVSEGKNSDYSRQLNLIGMVIYRRRIEVFEQETEQGKDPWMYDFNKTKIVLYEVNLFKGYIKEHPFTPVSYGEAVDYVHQTSQDIELFKRGRAWKEIPLHEYAYSESDYQCNTCPYRNLCDYLILTSHENKLSVRKTTENSFKITNLTDHVFDVKLVPISVTRGTFPNAEEVLFRQLNTAVRLISSKISGPAGLIWKDGVPHVAVPASADFDDFVAYLKPVWVTLQLQPEVYPIRLTKCSDQSFELIIKLLDFSIRKQIKQHGYLIEEGTGRFFYKNPLPGFENNSINLLHGFVFRLVPEGKESLSLCLDITYRYVDKNPFSDFISQKGVDFIKKHFFDKRPNPKIGLRFLYEMGDWTFPIEVFSISDKTVEEEIVLDRQTNEHISLYDYLLKKTNKHENKLTGLSREDRVVYYKYPGKEMDYQSAPASLIRQIYKPDDTKIGQLHRVTIKEINERFKFIRERITDEFQQLSFNGKPLTLESKPEVLTLQSFPLKDLKYNGNKLVKGTISENGRISINKDYPKQRKSLLQSVGVLKRGTMDDTQYLLVPDTLNFPKDLQYVIRNHFEGKARQLCPEFIGFKKVIYYQANKDSVKDLVDEVAYALQKEGVTEGFALIILPYWGKDDYKISLFHKFVKYRFKDTISFQCANSDKIQSYFERNGQGKFVFADEEQAKKFGPYLFNLTLEYLKLNERYPFALNNSPNYDIYIGIDVHQQYVGFSFFYRNGEVIKLERKQIPKPPSKTRNEKIREKDIYDIIYPTLKRHIPRYCLNPNAIIIGRDGCSHDEKHALIRTIKQLAKDEIIADPELPCAVFDLHKQSQIPYRAGNYDVNHGQYRTPMAGTFRLFGRNNEQAFLFSTGFPFRIRGSAKPLHFTMAFRQGDISFEKILEDMFGQCLLAFSAPDLPNRLPIMFKLLDDYLEPFGVSQRKLDEAENISEEDEDEDENDEDHIDSWDETASRNIDLEL